MFYLIGVFSEMIALWALKAFSNVKPIKKIKNKFEIKIWTCSVTVHISGLEYSVIVNVNHNGNEFELYSILIIVLMDSKN